MNFSPEHETTALQNFLTVDVEDYFQVSAFEHRIARRDWPSYPSRVEANTERLLQLFADCDVRGTFFVLGWVAERFPGLVRRIAAEGHELASHGYWHQLVYRLTPEAFRADLRASLQAISDAAGVRPIAYRAPSFSITQRSMWALEILVQEGFTIDSSIFPIHHDRYGVPGANPEIHLRETPAGSITEIPPSVGNWGPIRLPVGGGYFRLLPLPLTNLAIGSLTKQSRPTMLYLHPWEVDPQQPRIRGVGLRSRFRHYVGLRRTEPRLRCLLRKHSFTSIGRLLPSATEPQLDETPHA